MLEKKAVMGITLTLLLVGVFTAAFNIPLRLANINVTMGSNDHAIRHVTHGEEPSFSMSPYEKIWDFSRASEWRSFAKIDNDSTEIIIGINYAKPDSYEQLRQFIAENQGELVNTVSMNGKTIAAVADVPLAMMPTFSEKLRTSGLSRYVEPNLRFQASFVPNDPSWPQQWGPARIEADYAWNTTTGDPSVLVAVIDTGVDWNHPDLIANYVALGYDWVSNDADPMDDSGHGTHCAGIIAAVINNSIGIAGLAQVKVMAEKGLDWRGGGNTDDLANAIIHAVDQGADILSNSWGGYFHSELMYEAVKYAHDREVLVVAAAGNDERDLKLHPACYKEVVAVTATNRTDAPASFTTFGEWVELAAPGVDIYSTIWDNSYAYMSGTSMSTPHVAGVASLILSQFPSMTGNQLRLQLRYTADDLGDPGFDIYYGYGRINARRAVEEVPPEHDLNILSWDRPPYVEPSDTEKINVTALDFGFSDESSVAVRLLVNGNVVDSALVSSLLSGATATVSLSWNPTAEGKYNVTAHVVPVLGESYTVDNVKSAYINVRSGKFIMVPVDCQKIQEAVELARLREVIKVASGTYFEHVYIDKPVRLIGEDCNTTIIDANETGNPITIVADKVHVNDFTVLNSTKPTSGVTYFNGGCILLSVKDCVIANNRIINNHEGVAMIQCDGNNTVYNNSINGFRDAGVGAVFDRGNNFVYGNTVTNPLDETTLGIALIGWAYEPGRITCDNNTIGYNKVESKMGTDQYGIALIVSQNNLVFGNILMLNNVCLWMAHCKNNTVLYNTITNNYWGIIEDNGDLGGVNTFHHNNMINNTIQAESLGTEYSNIWDDDYPSGGNYWSDYAGVDEKSGPDQKRHGSDGIGDTPYILDENNQDRYPLMEPFEVHDIAVTNIASSEAVVGQGYAVSIEVTVENQGEFTENFNVTIYADRTVIDTKPATLVSGGSTTITFTWNTTGFAKGNYTISAYAMVRQETDTADNTYTDGTILVTVPGDINGNRIVDILDAGKVSAHWYPGPPVGLLGYGANADINNDGAVDIFDAAIVSAHWLQSW